ncbi:MAG: hypothetical protein OXQ29_18710 [Rhodospirillaceae bacterium]|nr:hypothetical protein [Rhodospirillaceae bacterium]
MMIGPLRSAVLLACLAAAPIWAQLGHPAKGAWSGYWGPGESGQRRVLLLLEWIDNEITGVINPGRNGAQIDRAELDASTWTLTIEADMPVERGGTARYVATGKIENLGSWTNRRYSGTYTHGDESGTFLMTLN